MTTLSNDQTMFETVQSADEKRDVGGGESQSAQNQFWKFIIF